MRKVSVYSPGISNIGSFRFYLSLYNIEIIPISVGQSLKTRTLIICGVSGLNFGNKVDADNARKWLLGIKKSGTRIIGICAGMQMLFKTSEESSMDLLGFMPYSVVKLNFSKNKKTFIGYRKLIAKDSKSHKAYFSHSYGVNATIKEECEELLMCEDNNGESFVAHFIHENIIGFQFHPEKSSKYWRDYFVKSII